MTETTEHVTATTDLSVRINEEGTDEVGRLAVSFNRMLKALEGSAETQRQLVADASHELRTPLTSLRTNLEVLALDRHLGDVDRKELLNDLIEQIEELTMLVGDLVDLARGQEPSFAWEEVRLDILVQEAVERARRRAPHLRFLVRLGPCLVRGAPQHLERAVANLIDNAINWSPHGGVIDIKLDGTTLSVRDHGPGISPSDLPHIFDRFYRAPIARGTPGSGLGLAIVRQVAETHGGSVEATNAPGGGGLLTLKLVDERL